MKKLKLIFVAITLIASYTLTAQVSINTDGTDPDASAMLDVKSTEKGMLIPRMTMAEIRAIANPADGLAIYNIDDKRFFFFDGDANNWKEIAIGTGIIYPGCGTISDNEGNIYNTVMIGSQCWMKENLNIGTMINGSSNQSQQTPEVIEKYCYDNNPANCDTFGGLYQWNEMMQYISTPGAQAICPTGWHIPTDEEWKVLEGTVDSWFPVGHTEWDNTGYRGVDAGDHLKSTTGWYDNGNGDDSFGFTVLPGGDRTLSGSFFNQLTQTAFFWSSDESGADAWIRLLAQHSTQVNRLSPDKEYGLSVRCLKD